MNKFHKILSIALLVACIEMVIEVFIYPNLSEYSQLTIFGKISLNIFVLILAYIFISLIVDFILWLLQQFR